MSLYTSYSDLLNSVFTYMMLTLTQESEVMTKRGSRLTNNRKYRRLTHKRENAPAAVVEQCKETTKKRNCLEFLFLASLIKQKPLISR